MKIHRTVTVTGTSATAGLFGAMQVVSAAVVSAMTWADDNQHTGDWSDLASIPAGTMLYGEFDSITLTSGEVVLYKRVS